MYDAVIFDNDGVLVELSDRTLFRRAAHDTFAAIGADDPPREHVDALQFVANDRVTDTLEPLAADLGVDPETLWTTRDEFAATAQLNAVRHGAKSPYPDVDQLADIDVPMGVVSNNQHATVDGVLREYDLTEHFETWYGRDHNLMGLRNKKPNPHYLNRAITDLDASNPLYVGDSRTDIVAAHRAGIDAAFLRRPHRRDYDLEITPEHELQGLDDLHPLLNGHR